MVFAEWRPVLSDKCELVSECRQTNAALLERKYPKVDAEALASKFTRIAGRQIMSGGI